MTRSNWNVLAYLNLETLHWEFNSLEFNLNVAKGYCKQRSCLNIYANLKKKMETLGERNKLIFERNREKRAIPTLHFVGDIFSDLFGTLGSKFEQEHDRDFSKLVQK